MKNTEEIKAKAAKQIAEATKINAVEQAVLDAGAIQPTFIHVHPIRGYVGSLNFVSSLGNTDNKLATSSVVKLLEALPPVPMVRITKGWTAFAPASYVDSDEGREEGGDRWLIAPVRLVVDCGCTPMYGYAPLVSWEWFTEINGETWAVCAYTMPYNLFSYSFDRGPVPREGGYPQVKNTIIRFNKTWSRRQGPVPDGGDGDGDGDEDSVFTSTVFSCGDGVTYGHRLVYYMMHPSFDILGWLKVRQNAR